VMPRASPKSGPGAPRAPDQERRRGRAVPEHEIIPPRLDALPHREQVAGHRDLLDGVGQLAVLDPDPDRAPRVVAGDAVDPEADQLGDVEPLAHALDDVAGI